MKLNLGSDGRNKEGYVNIDHRAEPGVDKIDDVFTLRDFENDSIEEIKVWHVLEHAACNRTLGILQRWYDILKPGGIIKISVPNLPSTLERIKRYQDNEWTYENWLYLNERFFGMFNLTILQYGDEEIPGVPGVKRFEVGFHKSLFDERTLRALLARVGFKEIIVIPTMQKEIGVQGTK